MNKASELLSALEQDQANALERFYEDWDGIVADVNYKRVSESTCCLRLSPVYDSTICLCPILAVYLRRFGVREESNSSYMRIGNALGLSHTDIRRLVSASDGWSDRKLDSYRVRLFKPFGGERHKT